jgi:hypothetical protein
MPVAETTPIGVASPTSPVSRSRSPIVAPAPARTVRRVDAHPVRRRAVGDQAAVADGRAGDVVAAAADGDRAVALDGERHGGDVRDAGRSDDHPG